MFIYNFGKSLLGARLSTQNDFIYKEFRTNDLKSVSLYNAIKHGLKVVSAEDRQYINVVNQRLLNNIYLFLNKTNWASLFFLKGVGEHTVHSIRAENENTRY